MATVWLQLHGHILPVDFGCLWVTKAELESCKRDHLVCKMCQSVCGSVSCLLSLWQLFTGGKYDFVYIFFCVWGGCHPQGEHCIKHFHLHIQ